MSSSIVPITNAFVEALNHKFKDFEFSAEPGRVYDKIWCLSCDLNDVRRPHAFIERDTGFLFKAEKTAKPAKDARYDLNGEENFTEAVFCADLFASYLYLTESSKLKEEWRNKKG